MGESAGQEQACCWERGAGRVAAGAGLRCGGQAVWRQEAGLGHHGQGRLGCDLSPGGFVHVPAGGGVLWVVTSQEDRGGT